MYVRRWGCTGVKLYTVEWREGSRGWTLKDPEAFRFLERCQELGVKNIHVHKGPTIWPLDKDGLGVEDVDVAATTFSDLNFVVEHVGLPRIEDFCFIAVQEPNVYAGLSVVIGGLMHARPTLFAKVMGELLFLLGEDRLIFGSDYAIWEPRWQIEGFVDWDYPSDEFSDYPRVNAVTKKKILGLNAARLYDLDCDVGPHGAVTVRLRMPTYFCPPNFVFMMVADARDAIGGLPGVTSVDVGVEDHFAAEDINGGVAARRTFVATFGDLAESELDGLRVDFLRKAVLAATDRVCQPLLAMGYATAQLARLTLADPPADANLQRLRDRRGQLGLPVDDRAPLLIDPATGARVADDDVAMHLRRASLTRMSMETNGEMCRSLLDRRYGETRVDIRPLRAG